LHVGAAGHHPVIQLLQQRYDRALRREACEHISHDRRLLGFDHQALLHEDIAQGCGAAVPQAAALGGGTLVADSLPDQLAFELGE